MGFTETIAVASNAAFAKSTSTLSCWIISFLTGSIGVNKRSFADDVSCKDASETYGSSIGATVGCSKAGGSGATAGGVDEVVEEGCRVEVVHETQIPILLPSYDNVAQFQDHQLLPMILPVLSTRLDWIYRFE